jgi:citrate synthase
MNGFRMQDAGGRDKAFHFLSPPPASCILNPLLDIEHRLRPMADEIYSPGLEGVIAGETAISTVSGGLSYRGYSIEDLARHGTFEEVAFLLLHGELPAADQLDDFRRRLKSAAQVPRPIIEMLRQTPASASPMDVLRSAASLLAHWDPDATNNSHEANVRKAERLLAQLPAVMAARHRLKQGKEPVPPESGRSLASNCLHMLFRADPPKAHVKAMDVSLILYAEHEYNASTFTARVIVSTLADLHSAIAGAIGALKGPLHGGANEKVIDVLKQVGKKENAESPGFARHWSARKRSWGSATACTKRAIRGPCTSRSFATSLPTKQATKTWKQWPM